MKLQRSLYEAIVNGFTPAPPEAGGILGERDGVVSEFYRDDGYPQADRAVYTPRVERLNEIIAQWTEAGIHFCGLLHTHPKQQETLSGDDLTYLRQILEAMPESVESLMFPVVIPGEKMIAFRAGIQGGELWIRPEQIYIT